MLSKNCIFLCIIGLILVLIISGCAKKIKVGDKIQFSGREWRVLAVQEDKLLIITDEVINLNLFHNNRDDITWESCYLRSQLTGIYAMVQFRDREEILETLVINDDNPVYGTPGGLATLDRIFLLSSAEVYQYFLDDNDRIAYHNGKETSWWLRTPGLLKGYTSSIQEDGSVDLHGSINHQTVLGVRPAMWINIPKFQAQSNM